MLANFDRFIRSDTDKLKEAEQILTLLKDSPELQERTRRRDEQRLDKIRGLLASREQIEREKAEAMPRLNAERDEAHDGEKAAGEALQLATQKRVNAEHARLSANLEFSSKLSAVEAELTKLAPHEIDEFVWEMLKADEAARAEVRTEQRPGAKGLFTGAFKEHVITTNSQSIEKKRAYIKAAIAEAQAMKLAAIPHEDVIRRLDELRAGFSTGNSFETVAAPLPDVHILR